MKKAFVISWFFPPINSSEGLVTFKLLKNSKQKYDVFTQKGNLSWTYGGREERLTSKNINTIFSKTNDFKEWVNEGIEYFRNHHNEYEYIMSRAMAPEAHEIALKIKEEFPEIKWIASFGDPIQNNPFSNVYKETSPYAAKGILSGNVGLKYVFNPKRIIKNKVWNMRHKRYLKKSDAEPYAAYIETNTIKYADLIILNNPYELEYMRESNPIDDNKVFIIPHTYDVDFYPKKADKKTSNKITMSFLGHLDYVRSPRNLFHAIKRIKDEDPNLDEKLEINFYGDMDNFDKLYLVDNFLLDVVQFKKSVDYFESLRILKNSDWVLNIDANFGTTLGRNIFFAAKIADCLGSGSEIFTITMSDGASADILRKTNHLISSHSEDEIYMNLKLILNNKIHLNHNKKEIEIYDARNVAKQFDEKVKELLK